jgi:haloacid dehalogenase-like hydrolase
MCANYRTLWVTLPTNKPAISERPRDPMTMRSTPWVLAGMLRLTDPIRPDATATIQALRDAGVRRVTMLSGDHASVAARIGAALKVDAVLAEQSPADKIEAVRAARAQGTTVMVGRWHQRCPGTGGGRCRSRDGRAGGQPRHRRRRMSCCWSTGWTGWPWPWASRAGAEGSRCRVLSLAWACRCRDGDRGGGMAAAGARRPAPGGHRHRRHPERATGAAG